MSFQVLLQLTYIRGYLLNYANYVGLEAQKLSTALMRRTTRDTVLQSLPKDHASSTGSPLVDGDLLVVCIARLDVVYLVKIEINRNMFKFQRKRLNNWVVEQERFEPLQIDHAMHHTMEELPALKQATPMPWLLLVIAG